MVAPLAENAFHFTGITAPGNNPQAAPVAQETDVRVNTTENVILSPDAQDASRAVTAVSETIAGPATSQVDNQRRQEEPDPEIPAKEYGESEIEEAFVSRAISYTTFPDINRTQASVIDRRTDEVIREVPSEKAIKISQQFAQLIGTVFDESF